jgi:ACS family tartrate transporter-like MFS transporter
VLLNLHWFGVSGWRWLLILEGVPAVVCGAATVFFLTDRPGDARWLSEDERAWITGELEQENRAKTAGAPDTGLLRAYANWTAVSLVAGYFFINLTAYGLFLWLPKMVQRLSNLTLWQVSLLASLPHLCAIPAMIVAGWNADRTGRHKQHAVIATVVAAAGLAMSQLPGASATLVVIGFCIAEMGLMSYYPGYWSLPSKLLSPRVAAAVCGLITLANIGGFVGPYAIGFLIDLTGSQMAGVLVLVMSSVLAGASIAFLRTR